MTIIGGLDKGGFENEATQRWWACLKGRVGEGFKRGKVHRLSGARLPGSG